MRVAFGPITPLDTRLTVSCASNKKRFESRIAGVKVDVSRPCRAALFVLCIELAGQSRPVGLPSFPPPGRLTPARSACQSVPESEYGAFLLVSFTLSRRARRKGLHAQGALAA